MFHEIFLRFQADLIRMLTEYDTHNLELFFEGISYVLIYEFINSNEHNGVSSFGRFMS